MERTKQKAKKEKPNKYVDKQKSPSFIADVKTLKENLKIREILRTVKMNSSMRIKAPRGSKVMQHKDFHDGEDIFDDSSSNEGQDLSEPPSATNLHFVNAPEISENESATEECSQIDSSTSDENLDKEVENVMHKSKSLSEGLEGSSREETPSAGAQTDCAVLPSMESPLVKTRDRKLSLDQTMLSKRHGLSQSEVDLHSIGKLPLERKSSFFKKKMDSFLKNTTEIFKRQTSRPVERSGSTCSRMSVSMLSLNENEVYNGDHNSEALEKYNDERGSMSSLRSATLARSNSSLSASQSDRYPEPSDAGSLRGSRLALDASQPLTDASDTIYSISEGYNQEAFLHSRAISMSSGLDTAHGPRKRKTSRSNRVTWVASESLTDYFRRLIQDEKTKEMQSSNSYQDFSTIPEDFYGSPKTDSKGRRLSYQRAVSGEDPVLPTRYQDSSLRRKKITESTESHSEVSSCLAEFSRSGVPALLGYKKRIISAEALLYLAWAEIEDNLEEHYFWKSLPPVEEARQAVIKELIHTEAVHIRHLMDIIDIYIATAHALQDVDKLLDLETRRLFLNIPDVLNASLSFWEIAIYPMIADSFNQNSIFNSDLMAAGFFHFGEILDPYEEFVCHQSRAVDYLRALSTNADFVKYLTWCCNRNPNNRLQLADIMVKPMQRLTKYSLILRRIHTYTNQESSKQHLASMEAAVISYLHRVNRAIRRREEINKVEDLSKIIDPYDIDFKDEDLDRYFHMMNELNLKAPMINCGRNNCRTIIYEGDLRFKDNLKETEVRAILFTDMLLICKKHTKGGNNTYKMIRPKYMLDKTVSFPRYNNRNNPYDISGLNYVVLDDLGTAYTAFCLTEPAKDPNPQQTLKTWEQKIREARLCYELSIWFHKYPVKDASDIEADYSEEAYKKTFPEDWMIERRARERVATMIPPLRPPSTVQEATTKSNDDEMYMTTGPPSLRDLFGRTSAGSSRNSRLSSFYQSTSSRNSRLSSFQQSTSAASHDEPAYALKNPYRTGSSVEHIIPPQYPDEVACSITVNVVGESECETTIPSRQPSPPLVVLEHSSPNQSPSPRSSSACGNHNTLRVSPPHSAGLIHSLPDLSVDPTPRPIPLYPSIPAISASEKLYQSHQELLLRNRLAATQRHQFLTPDHRGASYPPPSPTRASLRRGLAFSYSTKNPPLSKMGHVNSQSQVHIDPSQPSSSQMRV